jgi:hypothetical protein
MMIREARRLINAKGDELEFTPALPKDARERMKLFIRKNSESLV